MKKLILSAALLLAAMGAAHAEKADSNKPTEISFDNLDADDVKQIKKLEGSKTASQVDGEFISYDSRREFFAVKNTASGESKPGAGRSTMVIQPSAKQAPAPATNPAAGK